MDPPKRYAYMFTAGNHRLLFVRNYGSGSQCQAQLVHDIDTGNNLIRKVTTHRLVPTTDDTVPNWRPKSPREVRILHTIRQTFNPPEPGFNPYLPQCYGHEYIKSTATDQQGRPKYHSVSYWKLYNGGSLRSRWLQDGKVLPPSVAVARMARQVLSTLHYLYTAGPQPIYHEDTHFGNIWAHWTPDQNLPDFYLGDLADAGHADSRFGALSLHEKVLRGRPVTDLRAFSLQLQLLADMLGEQRGRGEPRVRALRALLQGVDKVVANCTAAADSELPPDLKGLVLWAGELEAQFGEGGQLDETGSEVYREYVAGERRRAGEVGRETGLVVVGGSVEEALRPSSTSQDDGARVVPMAIHGPWQLVAADTWVPIEDGGVSHHRPNGNRGIGGEHLLASGKPEEAGDYAYLSGTLDRPSMFDGGYLEEYGDGGVVEGPFTPVFFADPNSPPDPRTPPKHTLDGSNGSGTPESSEKSRPPSPTFSFTIHAGDETACSSPPEATPAKYSQTSSPTRASRRPSPTPASMLPMLDIENNTEFRARLARTQGFNPSPPRWAAADEPDFYVKDLLGKQGLRGENIKDFDMEQYTSQCEARFREDQKVVDRMASRLRARRDTARAAKEAPQVLLESFEDTCRRWHMLVHDINCRCQNWIGDVEAVLRLDRTKRLMNGFKLANFSLEDPTFPSSG